MELVVVRVGEHRWLGNRIADLCVVHLPCCGLGGWRCRPCAESRAQARVPHQSCYCCYRSCHSSLQGPGSGGSYCAERCDCCSVSEIRHNTELDFESAVSTCKQILPCLVTECAVPHLLRASRHTATQPGLAGVLHSCHSGHVQQLVTAPEAQDASVCCNAHIQVLLCACMLRCT
jgi:hypothetical protein